MDFINEIVHENGKFKAKGDPEFIKRHDTISNVNRAIDVARKSNSLVALVRVAFDHTYSDQPKNSVLFGKAHEFGALTEGTWAT